MNEELIKRAVGCEAKPHCAASKTVFLELEKISAKVVRGKISPFKKLIVEPHAKKSNRKGVVLECLRRRILLGGHELDEGIDFAVSMRAHR